MTAAPVRTRYLPAGDTQSGRDGADLVVLKQKYQQLSFSTVRICYFALPNVAVNCLCQTRTANVKVLGHGQSDFKEF